MSTKSCSDVCCLCERAAELTFHHLIPRKVHRRPRFKKNYTKEQLNAGVMVCRDCHRTIHKFYSESELANRLNTLELIKAEDAITDYLRYIRKRQIIK